jgi:hypothetical protein
MILRIPACLLLTLALASAQSKPGRVDVSPAEGDKLGSELAAEIVSIRFAQTNSGWMRVRDGKGMRTEIPFSFEVTPGAVLWSTVYETYPGDKHRGVKLTVLHAEGKPNEYVLVQKGAVSGEQRRVLRGNESMIPFAGTDFWLADLGLEFFHWPQQRVLFMEIRRGQSCKVIESINPSPAPGGYARVVAWVDIDTNGIVHAEAFDANKRMLKIFAPKEFKRVRGEWQLRSMEMLNRRTNSRTQIEFNLETQ